MKISISNKNKKACKLKTGSRAKSARRKKAFTLAEVLLTCAIVGVLAAVCTPVVVNGIAQKRYSLSLKKSIKVVQDAISMNIAQGYKTPLNTTPYTDGNSNNLFYYLQKSINAISPLEQAIRDGDNSEFTTHDGFRFEFPRGTNGSDEFSNLTIEGKVWNIKDSGCGTRDLNSAVDDTASLVQPCVILVDVNGDDPPNTVTGANDTKLSDMILLIVTDKTVFPYGTAAQKAYYN